MRTRMGAFLGVACAALVVGGCVSLKRTPEARFFVLRSIVEPPAAPATPAAGTIGVVNARLPGHLERPQIIVWRAPNEVRIDEFTRWAEPIGGAVTRVLAENLAALLPERAVLRYPWPAPTKLIGRLAVEIQTFAPQPSGEVRLEGRWTILAPEQERAVALRSFSLTRGPLAAGPGGADPGASVEAMSALLADLAREIAPVVRELPAPSQATHSSR